MRGSRRPKSKQSCPFVFFLQKNENFVLRDNSKRKEAAHPIKKQDINFVNLAQENAVEKQFGEGTPSPHMSREMLLCVFLFQ